MNSVIRIDSNNPNIWNNKDIIHYKQGKFTDSVNSFSQAAGIDPGLTDALYNKGLVLMKTGKYSQAVRGGFRPARKEDPYLGFTTEAEVVVSACSSPASDYCRA